MSRAALSTTDSAAGSSVPSTLPIRISRARAPSRGSVTLRAAARASESRFRRDRRSRAEALNIARSEEHTSELQSP